MVGRHHRLNRHEFEQTPGDSEGQGSLARCNSWDGKESDTTKQLNINLPSFFPYEYYISLQSAKPFLCKFLPIPFLFTPFLPLSKALFTLKLSIYLLIYVVSLHSLPQANENISSMRTKTLPILFIVSLALGSY